MRSLLAIPLWLILFCGFAVADNTLLFVPLQPCRTVDTRGDRTLPASLDGPPIAGNGSRDFHLQDSPCNIPANAVAYSLNVTAVPFGKLIYITIWPTGTPMPFVSTLNSPGGYFIANAAIVPAGVNGMVSVFASDPTQIIIDINGYFIPYVAPVIPPSTTVQQITQQVTQQITQTATLQTILSNLSNSSYSLGLGTGNLITGTYNTAIGTGAFASNQSGNSNVAIGTNALTNNVDGMNNVAIGTSALGTPHSSANVAIGTESLKNFVQGNPYDGLGDGGNVSIGYQALWSDHNGKNNIGIGTGALYNSEGTNNIAIGYQSGIDASGFLNDSIFIGNSGTATDTATIRIGKQGLQTRTFIAGITNNTMVSATGSLVADPNGQIGYVASSRTVKEDITTLDDQTTKLMKLRPVTFRYKKPAADGSKPLHIGLIAEEVDEVYPQLVVKDDHGKVITVAYHELPALLLKQIQVQQKLIDALEDRIKALETRTVISTQ